MSLNGEIDADLIRIDKPRSNSGRGAAVAVSPAPTFRAAPAGDPEGDELEPESEQSERQRVIAALEQAGWVQARAARLLGMTPRQIAYRIQTLNIEVRQI
jgi:Nif-specific regulatory protein